MTIFEHFFLDQIEFRRVENYILLLPLNFLVKWLHELLSKSLAKGTYIWLSRKHLIALPSKLSATLMSRKVILQVNMYTHFFHNVIRSYFFIYCSLTYLLFIYSSMLNYLLNFYLNLFVFFILIKYSYILSMLYINLFLPLRAIIKQYSIIYYLCNSLTFFYSYVFYSKNIPENMPFIINFHIFKQIS